MPLSEKLGRPFELLSIRRHKKKDDESQANSSTSARSQRSSSSSSSSHHHASAAYMPSTQPSNTFHPHPQQHRAPQQQPHAGGFYSSVQYERLTPSRPIGGTSGGVQYERLAPPSAASGNSSGGAFQRSPAFPNHHSPNVVQYERLTPSSSSSSSSLSGSVAARRPPVGGNIPSIRQNSPLDYEMRSRTPGVGVYRDSPAPSIASLPSPGMLTPLVTASEMGRSPMDLVRPLDPRNIPSPNVVANGGAGASASGSDKSTPFSAVMEEWMSNLRTPTPDVTLLPSPYDFNKDMPTPLERTEDLKHIHSALLPTPPPDVHDQTQNPKSSEYVLNVSRRPLVEDIASLCRDLISQDGNNARAAPHGYPSSAKQQLLQSPAMLPKKTFPGPSQILETETKRDVRIRDLVDEDEYDDDEDDKTSQSGGSKGKRRKMCTADGCTNLSRSRGLCKAHGGGRRCSVDGCTRASQSGSLCITHGGGKRCTVDGCVKAAQSRGMCKAHGGGVRCRVDGCTKSSQGDGFCRSHGGGRRCGHSSGCTKWAQRNGMCMAHSEGKYGNSYRGRLHRMQDGAYEQQLNEQHAG
ncbi:hypothetical protein FI667_g6961, partial [Globisporangium splendens]